LTYARVLAYDFITVQFQLRSSINVRLTESSLYNRFCIEMSPQNGVLGAIFGREANISGGNPLGMKRPSIYAFLDMFGSDFTRRVTTRRILYGYGHLP